MYDRKKPCKTCPVRTNDNGLRRLGTPRAQEIADSVFEMGESFTCHDDLNLPCGQRNQCAGMMLLMQKVDRTNQAMRVGERMNWFDPSELTGHNEVFDTVEEWVESQATN